MGQSVPIKFSFGRFFLQRLFSLTGVFSLALFLLLQIGTASLLLFGSKETVQTWMDFQGHLTVFWLEVIVITLPVTFHFLYGLKTILQPRYNLVRYPFLGNLRFSLQKFAGLILFFFVVFHLWQLVSIWWSGAEGHQYVRDIMFAHRTVLGVILYWGIMILASFYWWNGTWNALIDWGVTASPLSQRVSLMARMVLFGVMAAYCVGMMIIGGVRN